MVWRGGWWGQGQRIRKPSKKKFPSAKSVAVDVAVFVQLHKRYQLSLSTTKHVRSAVIHLLTQITKKLPTLNFWSGAWDVRGNKNQNLSADWVVHYSRQGCALLPPKSTRRNTDAVRRVEAASAFVFQWIFWDDTASCIIKDDWGSTEFAPDVRVGIWFIHARVAVRSSNSSNSRERDWRHCFLEDSSLVPSSLFFLLAGLAQYPSFELVYPYRPI